MEWMNKWMDIIMANVFVWMLNVFGYDLLLLYLNSIRFLTCDDAFTDTNRTN